METPQKREALLRNVGSVKETPQKREALVHPPRREDLPGKLVKHQELEKNHQVLEKNLNLVLYLGKEWDGSRSLHELLGVNRENEKVKELLPFVADYRLNIIPVRAIKDPENYKSCLQHIFYMLKFNEDKEKLYGYVNTRREELDRMDSVEMSAAFAMLGEQKRLRKLVNHQKREGKEIGMCKAIDDLILDGEERGREQGERIGEKRGREKGERIGEKRGQERLARLIVVLSENHKDDLIIKAASDRTFRRKLFKEYNL